MKNTNGRIRIAIADKPSVIRDVARAIARHREFVIAVRAANGAELIKMIADSGDKPDICMFDLQMRVKSSYETILEIRECWPAIKILIYTDVAKHFAVRYAIHIANGYLHKDQVRYLVHTLTNIHKDGYYTDYHLLPEATIRFIHDFSRRHKEISARQLEFLSHLGAGLRNKQIADKMHLKPRSVEDYRSALSEKTEVDSRAGLAMLAITMGLVPFDE